MALESAPEPWLRGPLPGVPLLLQPAAHCLAQCAEDIPQALLVPVPVSAGQLAERAGGIPSLAFQLRHVAGSIDRLLTYARHDQLDDAQRAALAREGEAPLADESAEHLTRTAVTTIDEAMAVLRGTDDAELLSPRFVGRARLASTLGGVLFHIAEHTQRHTGQIVITAKQLRASATG